MIKFSISFLTLGFIILFFSGCATTNDVTIRTLEGENADFSTFQTYYVLPEPPIGDGTNLIVRSYPRTVVETAVRRELNNRNYKEIKDREQADMLVAIQFSLKDEQRERRVTDYNRVSTYGNRYGGSRYGYGYRHHYGYRTFPTTTIQVENFRKGNMIIDIIDAKKNTLVWEAFAQGKGETDLDAIQEKVNRVVARIFTKYLYTAKVTTS